MPEKNENILSRSTVTRLLFWILLVGAVYRLYFFSGHIFSDDSYTAGLTRLILETGSADGYTGYPVTLLRTGMLFLTGLGYLLLGYNEYATLLFPFILSLFNIYLAYGIGSMLTGSKRTGLLAAILIAFIPTEVFLSTINFADLPSVVFANFSVFLLLKANRKGRGAYAIAAGFALFFAFLCKVMVPAYTVMLLGILSARFYKKGNRPAAKMIFRTLSVFVAGVLLESFVYLIFTGDFLYRIHITSLNYNYAWYNFFPYSVTGREVSGWEYFTAALDTVFIKNPRYLFIRRFYLFLPFAAAIFSIHLLSKRKLKLTLYWLFGLSFLLIAGSTSPFSYRPLLLDFSWYGMGIFIPAAVIVSHYLKNLDNRMMFTLLVIYILGSYIMMNSYHKYLDVKNLQQMTEFLLEHPDKTIYTDFHTGYGVSLVTAGQNKISTFPYNAEADSIAAGDWLIYSELQTEELEKQGHPLDYFDRMNTGGIKKIKSFGKFTFYKKE